MVARDRNRKIIMVGPAVSGKTVLANLFTDQVDLTKTPYRATTGVRILETDVAKTVPETSLPRSLAVQLWDIGGKKENQQFWNACLYGTDGCIIVYDGDKPGQEKELESLLHYFTQRPESAILKPIPLSNLLCIAIHKTRSRSLSTASGLPPDFTGKITEIHHIYEDEPTVLKSHFTKFVNEIIIGE